jgi:hypothetical protein
MDSIPEALAKLKNDTEDFAHLHSSNRVQFILWESGRELDRPVFSRLSLQDPKWNGHEHSAGMQRHGSVRANRIN